LPGPTLRGRAPRGPRPQVPQLHRRRAPSPPANPLEGRASARPRRAVACRDRGTRRRAGRRGGRIV